MIFAFRRVGRMVMQRIANPYYVYKRRVGSTPTLSAIFLFLFLFSCHPAVAYDDIIAELRNYVTVEVNTESCERDKKTDGWYIPWENKIHFCKNNIIQGWPADKHDSVFRKVLLHEAVHVAQDCKAGFSNNILENISVNTVVPEYVKKRYSKEWHDIEAEAFFYWHKGNKPLELVKEYC